ncbi:hypothetical protein GOP47_0026602 [Adiantum capillus-veneris]|nr:hypothetical protein GOP47_0026602 [Adiantum capillus-veneris]
MSSHWRSASYQCHRRLQAPRTGRINKLVQGRRARGLTVFIQEDVEEDGGVDHARKCLQALMPGREEWDGHGMKNGNNKTKTVHVSPQLRRRRKFTELQAFEPTEGQACHELGSGCGL